MQARFPMPMKHIEPELNWIGWELDWDGTSVRWGRAGSVVVVLGGDGGYGGVWGFPHSLICSPRGCRVKQRGRLFEPLSQHGLCLQVPQPKEIQRPDMFTLGWGLRAKGGGVGVGVWPRGDNGLKGWELSLCRCYLYVTPGVTNALQFSRATSVFGCLQDILTKNSWSTNSGMPFQTYINYFIFSVRMWIYWG